MSAYMAYNNGAQSFTYRRLEETRRANLVTAGGAESPATPSVRAITDEGGRQLQSAVGLCGLCG